MRRPNLKNLALNLVTAVVSVAALAMVGIRAKQQFPATSAAAVERHKVAAWRDFVRGRQRFGPSTAAVTIVEFSDFQCPFCRQATVELRDIRQEFPDQVAIVFRHYPLPSHQFATAAAEAAECAARQGAFEKYQELLFASPDSIGRKSWGEFAEEARVPDAPAFRSCMSDPAIAAVVKEDRAAGERLGVIGTPTFLINDLEVSGYPGKGKLAELVRSALDTNGARSRH